MEDRYPIEILRDPDDPTKVTGIKDPSGRVFACDEDAACWLTNIIRSAYNVGRSQIRHEIKQALGL